jgi:transcriptional regulator with XRE-family HTH domain
MRQREQYATSLIRVNTVFLDVYAMTLTRDGSKTYAVARSQSAAYAQGLVGLGDNIKALRVAAGQENAAAFARSINVTPATLNDWETGRYENLRLDSLLRIAKGLGCAVEELLQGVDPAYDKIIATRRDLVGQTTDQKSGFRGGEPDVTTSAAQARVQQRYDALIAATDEVVHRLVDTLLSQGVDIQLGGSDAGTRSRKPRARARARKAG